MTVYTFLQVKTDIQSAIEDTSDETAVKILAWANQAIRSLMTVYYFRAFRAETDLTPVDGVIEIPTASLVIRRIFDPDTKTDFYEQPPLEPFFKTYYYISNGFNITDKEELTLYGQDDVLWASDVTLVYQKEHAALTVDGSKIYLPCRQSLYWSILQLAYQNRMYMTDAIALERWLTQAIREEIAADGNAPKLNVPQGLARGPSSYSLHSVRKRTWGSHGTT